MAFKYLTSSSFTFGANKNKPITLGNTIANIIASENSITDPRLEEAPMTTKIKNSALYEISANLLFPNKYFHPCIP